MPAIFRWPGRIAPGRECAEVASVLDLFPTMARFSDSPLPRDRVIDGAALDGALTGRAGATKERLFCYYFGAQLQAVRLGRWKLILKIDAYPEKPRSIWYNDAKVFHNHYRLMPQAQLFDLEADPAESANLAGQHPDIVRRLDELARQFDAGMQRDKRLEFGTDSAPENTASQYPPSPLESGTRVSSCNETELMEADFEVPTTTRRNFLGSLGAACWPRRCCGPHPDRESRTLSSFSAMMWDSISSAVTGSDR